MNRCEFRDGSIIADYGRPYIVAEVNSSHGGDVEVAKQMIDVAVNAGADCVKFQSWNKHSLYSKTYYRANRLAERFVERFTLSPEQLKGLAEYCKSKCVAFSSTPYSEQEVDFLINEINVPYIKIASMELNNLRYLSYIGSKQVPVVLSTGMGEMREVERAVSVLGEAGAEQIVLLHCVSIYPTDLKTVNLNNIIGLREKFPEFPIGFSDHTLGNAAGIAAVALGSGFLEKHLTLNRKQVGMDNRMATEPEEFKTYIEDCRKTQIAMGRKERIVSEEEYKQRENMRRSVIAARDLPIGTVIQESDLYTKRPGTGIAADKLECLIGMRVIHAIEADTVICINDLS